MKYSIFLLLIAIGIMIPHFAAVQAITLNLDYPKFGPFDLNTNQSLPEIIGFFYYFIVGISGLAAFVMLVWGGVQWLTSGAIPSQAGEARDKLKNAIMGLLLVLASFLIIQIINPELTVISGKPLVDPCSDPANAVKCTQGTAILPGGAVSGITLTVDGQPSKTIIPPATGTIQLAWSTGLASPVCGANTLSSNPGSPVLDALFDGPQAAPSGTKTIDLSSVSALLTDGTILDFDLGCTGTGVPTEIHAKVFVIISSTGGSPPVINYFEVRESGTSNPWLPGSPTGTPSYKCCGLGTDFPTNQWPEFRWDATAATCRGEVDLDDTFVNGSKNNAGIAIPWPFSTGLYRYKLTCIDSGTVSSEIRIEILGF